MFYYSIKRRTIQVKITRYYNMPTGMARRKNTDNSKCGDRCNLIPLLQKTVDYFCIKSRIHLSQEPTTPYLNIYPREMNAHIHAKTCTRMFKAALFIILKNCQVSKIHPATDWINK